MPSKLFFERIAVVMACAASLSGPAVGYAQGNSGATVYRCPGNPVLYTDAISEKEAKDRGCRTLEGAPITVIQSVKPRGTAASAQAAPASGERVAPAEQRTRDADRRAILEAELRKEEQAVVVLQKEFNNGEPDRRGDERNFQKYLDRVAEMKANMARKESDIAALKREISKLPQ